MILIVLFFVLIILLHNYLIEYFNTNWYLHNLMLLILLSLWDLFLLDNVIELGVVALITTVSIDFIIVFIFLYFLYFFFNLWFVSLKQVIISLMSLVELIKPFTSFIFFSIVVLNQFFLKVVQTGLALLFFVPFI